MSRISDLSPFHHPLPAATRVVKVGGAELLPGAQLTAFAEHVASRATQGEALVVVHGGGEEVSALCERLGIETRKVDGQRVTTPEVLPLVEGVLAGSVNSRLVAALSKAGVHALGLTGVSSSCVVAQDRHDGRLGLVGEPSRVDASFLRSLLHSGLVPVFAPLASDGRGGVLNVNADLFASGIAEALGARLELLTDVPGVLGTEGKVLASLTPSRIPALLEQGIISGGMVPKVEAAVRVLGRGAQGVWIGSLPSLGPSSAEGGTWIVPDGSSGSPTTPRGPLPSHPSSLALLPSALSVRGG
jgi:acetylglutamate kinase